MSEQLVTPEKCDACGNGEPIGVLLSSKGAIFLCEHCAKVKTEGFSTVSIEYKE